MPDSSREKLRRATVIYWMLLVYIIAALVWWFITLEKQNRKMANQQYQSLLQKKESMSLKEYGDALYNIDTDEIKIPTLLVQPFVENAIWHGLLHKEGERVVNVVFSEDGDETLVCVVEDNGIGRMAAKKINNPEGHTGKGLSVAEERIKTVNEQHPHQSSFKVEDL